jgi:short-subunit dehydrogenase
MKKYHGKNILITGAASGIGKLLAMKIAGFAPSSLILVDLNQEGLSELTKLLEVRTHIYALDLQDTKSITTMFSDLESQGISVDILINNAGVVIGKNFEEHTHENIDFTMKINTQALMHMALESLKMMKIKGEGHIVNIASAAGLVSNPGMSVYCASKWAVVGWSDSLRLEMEKFHPGIKVTTVLPYYINTGMFDGVKSPIIPILEPNYVVDKIIKSVARNCIFLRMPAIINFVPLLRGILPVRIFDFFAEHVFGIYSSMKYFKGRK